MARGEEKDTIGTKVESKVEGAINLAGLGAGGITGLSIAGQAPNTSITTPEGIVFTAGTIGPILGGALAGGKLSGRLQGQIAEKIDNLKPASMQNGELYLDQRDPLGIELDNTDLHQLSTERREQIHDEKRDVETVDSYVEQRLEEEDDSPEWIENLAYDEINGFQNRFTTSYKFNGDFKHGYVDEDEEVFIQAPKRGDTFQETVKRVKTWKENKDTLDQADQYLEQVLSKQGKESLNEGPVEIDIDYEFLRENEKTLRKELEGGIASPSENYDIVVTSHDGEPLPVLVGDYKADMIERRGEMVELENREEVKERKKVLGMYMDALIAEGEFEGHLGDFWIDEGYGREKTKNMFYDPEVDTVGVTDIGEYRGKDPDDMPDISVIEKYA